MRLDNKLQNVKGVGPSLAVKFAAAGVNTIKDLIYFFPRKYNDFSHVTPIADLQPGNVTVKGRVESITGRQIRRGLHISEAVIADKTSKVRAVWFNQKYRTDQLSKSQEYYFSGVYDLQRNRYVLQNPSAEQVKNVGVSTARIVPVYRESAGLKSHQIRKILNELLPLINAMPERLPNFVVEQEKLMPLGEALQNLHFPTTGQALADAKKRIAFEELLWLVLASQLNKQENMRLNGWQIKFDELAAKLFTKELPFKLTNAQKTAIWEAIQDFGQSHPMNRLLQGDVGSGKTAVAAMLAFLAAKQGFQAAFMAPTEILATQQAQSLANLLEPLNIRVALLVGSTKASAKTVLKERLKNGEIDIVVGTHALIQKNNDFHKLGFVVIDEQHRFGVRQRAELLTKSKKMPHLLSMTATPIPRSLQLTAYGELEVSILNELPKGRQPIETNVVSPLARHTVYEKINKQISEGRQAYVVCPLVSQGENAELKSVEAEHERLNKSVFKHRKVGLLHGQLKADEKEYMMAEFKAGKIDILICTTVIEVGVDVPNATVMLIEGAERFGLAQLHQLRGRVGRGSHQSYCYLVPSSAQSVSQRLRELESSNDGFYLAEADLKLRGPGEIYGRAQHGQLDLTFAKLTDVKLLKQVQKVAKQLAQQPQNLLQYKQLHEHVSRYRRLTSLN